MKSKLSQIQLPVRLFYLALGSLSFILISAPASAQPVDLPWPVDPACQSIITTGIAAVTCGTTEDVPQPEQFTFGLMNIDGVLPASGRIDVTSQVEMYHHPSWHVDSIGNVFGITMDGCGNTFVTASSNYGADFFGNISIIRYGQIGGGAQNLQAAGTIYKMDGKTGQASVFSVLPQQAFSFENISCEGGTTFQRNTGPGLGNITYSPAIKQFYVSNFEDGRIYRLDENGTILDSYDPLDYDNGLPGTPALSDIVYGLTVSPDGGNLFFGTSANVFSSSILQRIYAVSLNPDGSFAGTIDNTSLPAGATWNNFVGDEVQHYELDVNLFFITDVLSISDLEFTPSGDLLAGCRVSCGAAVHSSYNHGGMALLLNNSSGLYSTLEGMIHTGYPFSIGNSNECYGGVSVFETPIGPDQFVISSADILEEEGPHGLCIVPEGIFGSGGAPASPAGAISYGVVDDDFADPKGVGGDVKVFSQCDCQVVCPDEITAMASDTVICSGSPVSLAFTITGGNATMTANWTDQSGNAIDPENLTLNNANCQPAIFEFTLTAVCDEDSTVVLTDKVSITVFTSDIGPFVSTVQENCNIEVNIGPECADFLTVVGEIPDINPGDSGVVSIQVISNGPLQCASESFELSYNCPACFITDLTAEAGACVDSSFMVEINLSVDLGSDAFTVTDQDGNNLGTFNYADLPIQAGPLLGDSITVYTLTVQDVLNEKCTDSVAVGPKDCLAKCGFFAMPNVFSPNGDNLNDYFEPVGKWEFTVLEFKVFSRWGELVHDSVSPWDGKYNGEPYPSDVFFFTITVDTMCGIQKEEGDVTLLR